MAGQQQQGGNKRAWMLFGVCLLFVLLTSLTLADLFIFHFDEVGISILMCARCVTGVSYSILVRVVTHEPHGHQPRSSQTFDPQAFMNQVLDQVSRMNQQLVQDIQQVQEQFIHQIAEPGLENVNPTVVHMEPTGTFMREAITQQQHIDQAGANGTRMHLLTPAGSAHAYVHREPSSSADGEDGAFTRNAVHEAPEVHQEEAMFMLHEEVHDMPNVQAEAGAHEHSEPANAESGGKVNRRQVCAFILDHWREHHARPSIKFIRERTGCSQGLASECCRLVAREMNV